MKRLIRVLAAVALIGSGATAGCSSKEVEVDLGAPQTEEEQMRLAPLLEADQAMRDAHMRRLQQGEGQ